MPNPDKELTVEERIEQIRERQLRRYRSADALANSDKEDLEIIDFLLSLVKSQEAASPIDASATARRIVEAHVHETRAVGHTDCDACLDADANAVAAIISALTITATSMRSACVEKVKAIEAHSIVRTRMEEIRGAESFKADALTALESVSIQEQEAKQS